MDITELLKKSEGKTLEFKQDLSSSRGILRTIVSFSNTAGGTIIIGVEYKKKRNSPRGLNVRRPVIAKRATGSRLK